MQFILDFLKEKRCLWSRVQVLLAGSGPLPHSVSSRVDELERVLNDLRDFLSTYRQV